VLLSGSHHSDGDQLEPLGLEPLDDLSDEASLDTGPVVAMCWEGEGVVKTGRVMLGETNPKDSKPGTIRGDYCIQVFLSKIFA
jgi:hypothetical protein